MFYQNLSFKYFIAISGVLCLMVIGVFVHFYHLQKEAILGEVKNQARILCRQVLLTRSWLADMGGVYVKKRKGMEANPYLGSDSKIEGKDVTCSATPPWSPGNCPNTHDGKISTGSA